jgi:hypothetical protein
MAALGSQALRIAGPRAAAATEPAPERARVSWFGWLPLLVIGAGLALGLVLWGKWGFLIAFEAIRAYCF